MRVGFTGTRNGMTIPQKVQVDILLSQYALHFHHGDCIGADHTAHYLAVARKIPITIHPPINNKFRAFCYSDDIRKEKDYLDRDRDIVDESDLMIATPKGFHEELRSGTWHTIRYSKKKNKPLIIVWPDGSSSQFNM